MRGDNLRDLAGAVFLCKSVNEYFRVFGFNWKWFTA